MNGVLIDTSVWVDHFCHHNDVLANLLELDLSLTHPMILAELACGTPPARVQTLNYIRLLQQPQQASLREMMDFMNTRSSMALAADWLTWFYWRQHLWHRERGYGHWISALPPWQSASE